MTEEELNVQVQAAQDEIARLRETFGPAYAKLGEALYPAARETELATRFANEFEQARIAEEEAARAAEEAARAEAEAAAAVAKAATVEEPSEPADEPAAKPEPEPAKVRTCPKCGTTLQPTDKFCAGCGSKVADLFAPAAPHCSNCGKEVDESMNFCIYCGTSLK